MNEAWLRALQDALEGNPHPTPPPLPPRFVEEWMEQISDWDLLDALDAL
jgi:hypothetical protein